MTTLASTVSFTVLNDRRATVRRCRFGENPCRQGDELASSLTKFHDASGAIHVLSQQVSDLSFERPLIRPGLHLQPLDDPAVEIADGQIAHGTRVPLRVAGNTLANMLAAAQAHHQQPNKIRRHERAPTRWSISQIGNGRSPVLNSSRSGRFRRGYAVLVGRNRAGPRYHLRPNSPRAALNNVSSANRPAFAEGKDSARGYRYAQSCLCERRGVALSIRANFDRCPPAGADLPSGSRPARSPPVRSLLRSRWRHSSRDRSLDAERSYLWTASDRPAERLYA